MDLIIIIFVLVVFFILLNFAWAGVSAAPWVPSRKKDFKRVLELAGVKSGDIIYDLGSGDGRWLFYFAKQTPAEEIVGFEISVLMYWISSIKKLFRGYPHVKIILKSFYRVDLNKADVIICFLTPMAMKKLIDKFQKEMKPGSKLISYAFSLPGKNPEKISKISKKDISIYLYRF